MDIRPFQLLVNHLIYLVNNCGQSNHYYRCLPSRIRADKCATILFLDSLSRMKIITSHYKSLSQWLKETPLIKHTCPLCADASENLICTSCKTMLPNIVTQCFQCGLPLDKIDTLTHTLLCGQCLQTPPAFDACISPYHYALPINQFITQLKFHQKLHYARVLADLLIDKIDKATEKLPECIIPVPLHPARLRQRGFNQALEIARPIAKKYSLKLDSQCCKRIVSTPPQMEQNKLARQKNIRNAFRVLDNFNYQDIAIVDDVMTTGHTLNELARLFREHGAKRIQVWAVARS